jgi:hypothetical protein
VAKKKGRRFQDVTEIEEKFADRPKRDSKNSVPAVAEMLDPLHKPGRGRQRVIPKVSVYFVGFSP